MMKKSITILTCLFLLSFSLKAQKIKFIDSISYDKKETLLGNKSYKNIVSINKYKTKFNNWIKVGDTIEIGKPSKSNDIQVNNVAGIRTLTNNHTYIFLGTTGAALMGAAFFANDGMTGDKAVITGMKMGRISKKQPFSISLELNKVGGGRFLGSKKLARVVELDKALEYGEIINPKRGMSRKEAIAKLKEAKDLLDLDMMSKKDYEALKIKLAPIIKGGK